MIKVAVITGAARGIGLATTEKFLSEGWKVAMLDIDGKTQDQSHRELQGRDNAISIPCDVSQTEQVAAAVKKIESRFSRIDTLVNNAGIAVFKPVMDTNFEEWTKVMETNLSGPFVCTQACVPTILRGGGGSIVNITSISGVRASTLRVA